MEITSEEFKQKIENNEKIIIDFHGLWCGPCRAMKPTFDKISEELRNNGSEVKLYTMDVDKNRDLVSTLGIRSIPVIKSFKQGKEVNSHTGVLQENQIKQLVENLIND